MFSSKLKRLLTNAVNVIRRYSDNGSVFASGDMDKPLFKVALSSRLSSLVRPENYKLYLNPNLEKGTFKGNVKIDIHVKQEKSYINLHTNYLNINNVQVFRGDEEVTVSKYLEVKPLEQLLIHFENEISPGNYQIHIGFDGSLNRNIVGFYSSRLNDDRKMAASKFEPTYARQAFPCFDEPDFRATFDITLVKPHSYIALSNMNEVSKTFDEATKTHAVTFATSVPMSTYLACFVICDFDHIENDIDTNNIGKTFKLRSFAQKHQMHKIHFAQDIGKRATEFYIKYYEVPFPLPKLDMIAIPDYQSGATEHWGLITYRETAFLVDDTASVENKISVANTIAHELAHMWFGNLVTMKWWDEIWLNEGFATYMQMKALSAIEPSWTTLQLFLTKTMHPVLVTDAKLSSHPIVQTVETPDQITSIFDAISYNKGASVLRMLEGFIGEEEFRRGVSDYLTKHQFGNTVTQDLLSMLEPYFKKNHPDLNLTYIMDTWTKQKGYPLLTVAKSNELNTYVITQERFRQNPDEEYFRDSPYDYRWFIPVTYKTNKGTHKGITWFPNTAQEVKITLEEGERLLKVNNDQVGYYRVNYPPELWETLISQLKVKNKALTIADRAHLLNDVFALAEAEVVSYDLALNLTTYLTEEKEYVPWTAASAVFKELMIRLRNSLAYDTLQKYIQGLVTPLYNKLSWKKAPEGVIDRLLRLAIMSLATKVELPHAVQTSRKMFESWLNSQLTDTPTQIEPDLREVVYNNGMKSATLEDWEHLLEVYTKVDDPQELAKLRRALSAPRDPFILKRYLSIAWDEKYIRGQDYLNVLQDIAANPSGTLLVWDEVRSRWPEFVERFSLNSRYLGNLIPSITSGFNTNIKLKELELFFEDYPEAGAGATARARALETVRYSAQWDAKHEPVVAAWLNKHSDKHTSS